MIKGKNVNIKILEKRHLEKLRLMRNDPEINIFLTSVIPITEYMQEEWFKRLGLDSSKMYFSIENKRGAFMGIVRCDEWDKINQSIRIGIDIFPAYQRRGLATETYNFFVKHLFEDLGIHRVWLLVVAFNKPAIQLYKKLGFKVEGTQREAIFRNNKFNDHIMMSVLRNTYEKTLSRGQPSDR